MQLSSPAHAWLQCLRYCTNVVATKELKEQYSCGLSSTHGFFQGGGGSIRPSLEAGCPPLRGPPVTYSYSITFDIVHVESFPLLMAKAVLINECFALLNFRAPRRRKQSLSLSVLFFLLFVFQYICTGTLHTLCSRFMSVNRSRFPLHWLSFSC